MVSAVVVMGCHEPAPPVVATSPAPSASTSAREPAPRTKAETRAWLCECHRKSGMLGDCDEMGFDDPDADCLRTYADCARALACLRGEPGVGPTCLQGFRTAGAIARCARICRDDTTCGKDEGCTSEFGPPAVCWPK